jgi:hypothetical protein
MRPKLDVQRLYFNLKGSYASKAFELQGGFLCFLEEKNLRHPVRDAAQSVASQMRDL